MQHSRRQLSELTIIYGEALFLTAEINKLLKRINSLLCYKIMAGGAGGIIKVSHIRQIFIIEPQLHAALATKVNLEG